MTKRIRNRISRKIRDKRVIKKKTLVAGTTEEILIRSVPDPSEERGSLEKLFRG